MSGTGIDHDLLWSQVQRCNYLATYIQLIYTIYVITILNIIYIYLFTAVVLWESIVRLAFTKFIKKKKTTSYCYMVSRIYNQICYVEVSDV